MRQQKECSRLFQGIRCTASGAWLQEICHLAEPGNSCKIPTSPPVNPLIPHPSSPLASFTTVFARLPYLKMARRGFAAWAAALLVCTACTVAPAAAQQWQAVLSAANQAS